MLKVLAWLFRAKSSKQTHTPLFRGGVFWGAHPSNETHTPHCISSVHCSFGALSRGKWKINGVRFICILCVLLHFPPDSNIPNCRYRFLRGFSMSFSVSFFGRIISSAVVVFVALCLCKRWWTCTLQQCLNVWAVSRECCCCLEWLPNSVYCVDGASYFSRKLNEWFTSVTCAVLCAFLSWWNMLDGLTRGFPLALEGNSWLKICFTCAWGRVFVCQSTQKLLINRFCIVLCTIA